MRGRLIFDEFYISAVFEIIFGRDVVCPKFLGAYSSAFNKILK